MFYSKDEFVKYAKQQIIVNDDLIKGWQIVAKGVKKFDGKVINVRLTRYINTDLKKEFVYSGFSFEIKWYQTWFNLAVRDNDSFPSVRSNGVTYVDYRSSIGVPSIEQDNKRIDAKTITADIEMKIEGLKKASEQLQAEINNIDNIVRKFKSIEQQIQLFNHSYSAELKELCKF